MVVFSQASDISPPPAPFGERVAGYYSFPDPDTGKPVRYKSVTNFIKIIADNYSLHEWEKRVIVHGLTVREDLYVKACSIPFSDRRSLDGVISQARVAGGGDVGSNMGTAFHTFSEAWDRGEDARVPDKYARKQSLYTQALHDVGVEVVPELIERVLVIPKYGLAGRIDRGLMSQDLGLVVGDLKTARAIHGFSDIAMQLALYANAEYMWDPDKGEFVDAPAFNIDRALVIRLPVDTDVCDIYSVDIAAGWRACELADQVRLWRNAGKRNLGGHIYKPALIDSDH